jgi:glycosidase
MSSARRLHAVLAVIAVSVAGAVGTVLPAQADDARVVTLVGNLQDEVGCPQDWDPACEDSELTRIGTTTRYEGVFDLPGGTYEYKVAVNGSWDENYGAGGAPNGANLPLVTGGTATLKFSYDDDTHLVTVEPVDLAGAATNADRRLAGDSLRESLTRERFYFVMADRFANGDTSNDTGGLTGGRSVTGFDPSDKAYYHGGDLAGLTDHLDYIKGLGTTAIWLTPSFKNRPVQGTGENESAGYHGYWITDFTQVDPHLGTNAELKTLIAQAHKKGMKVFFDIITNHTADVIDYKEAAYSYRSKKAYPYKKADGTTFDDRDYVNKPFPPMDVETSFPYTPYFHSTADANLKVPSWLNDPLLYHNRGDSTFAGESSTYGDFVGLDDLFTERPEVVEGMGDIYKAWVDFGVDGFRIDTVKHVNIEFWQKFIPEILGEADKVGNDDFFAFGEVYDGNPAYMSQFTTAGKLQATLDFGFQQQGDDFAKGKSAAVLADFFAKDDWYTDTDSNAYQLPTFLGNHDMGRVAMFLKDASANEAELLKRVKLADSLMYTVRGNPVTYYGDEQGFIGTGGDQLAREDMFASEVDIYNSEDVLAGPEGSRDRYDRNHPIYQHLKALARVRADNPALADGAQVARYAADGAGIFAISRIGREPQKEYLVVANNSTTAQKATIDTWTTRGRFVPVFGTKTSMMPKGSGAVTVEVPPLSLAVWKATAVIDRNVAAPTVSVSAPERGVSGRAEIAADVESGTFAQTTFLYRQVGAKRWTRLGTDDNAPFRVFHDVSGMPLGSLLEYRAVVEDARGKVAAASTWSTVVEPETSTIPQNGDPVTQPSSVAIAGTLNTEMGCPADWEPWCEAAWMDTPGADGIWKKSSSIPAGTYSYKAALDGSWTENYGAGGAKDGPNIDLDTPDGEVNFYYDDATHWVTSDENSLIITAPGSYQSELGCGADWDPACMRPWLQDPDGDGVYALILTIPGGTWEFKVAHGLSWDESYGDGGGSGNIQLTVPDGGAPVTFLYDSVTHQTTVEVG